MGDPWFRKFGGFGYRPICWQGVAVLALMLAVFAPCAWLFLFHRDVDGLDGWGAATLAFAAVLAGHGIVLWKLERDPC